MSLIPGAIYQYQHEVQNRYWYIDLKRGRLTWYYQIVPTMNIVGNILVLKGNAIMLLRKYEDDLIYISFLYRNSILNLHAIEGAFSYAWVKK